MTSLKKALPNFPPDIEISLILPRADVMFHTNEEHMHGKECDSSIWWTSMQAVCVRQDTNSPGHPLSGNGEYQEDQVVCGGPAPGLCQNVPLARMRRCPQVKTIILTHPLDSDTAPLICGFFREVI